MEHYKFPSLFFTCPSFCKFFTTTVAVFFGLWEYFIFLSKRAHITAHPRHFDIMLAHYETIARTASLAWKQNATAEPRKYRRSCRHTRNGHLMHRALNGIHCPTSEMFVDHVFQMASLGCQKSRSLERNRAQVACALMEVLSILCRMLVWELDGASVVGLHVQK